MYSSQQLKDHVTDLSSQLYSNPHSRSPSSKLTTSLIDSTRELVLRHFGTDTDHYDVVFTAGCTAALNLLCHAFPWCGASCNPSPGDAASVFCYLDDNHTSVVGMREVALKEGAKVLCVSAKDIRAPTLPVSPLPPSTPFPPSPPHHLFACPAQSNFCGLKYPLSWCEDIPSGRLVVPGCEGMQGGWCVVLDAAALVSTSPLVLSPSGPHFVTLSFYKMFGFPTGLGALLVRKDCAVLLSKAYYGGGTVKATDSWSGFHMPRDQLHERYLCGCNVMWGKAGLSTTPPPPRTIQLSPQMGSASSHGTCFPPLHASFPPKLPSHTPHSLQASRHSFPPLYPSFQKPG